MRSDAFIADHAVQSEAGPGMSVQNPYCVRYALEHVLCFDPSLACEIRRVKGEGMSGGGLFNCRFTGAGSIAVTAHGQPMVIPVTAGAPVFVDTDAIIGWSAGMETSIRRSESARSLLKGGSGEMFQLKLEGEGSAIVQRSEGPIDPDGGNGGGLGDAIGDFLSG